jgi:type IX secretion system PorP/SprF family membrane protein
MQARQSLQPITLALLAIGTLVVGLWPLSARAQQEALFTQFMFNRLVLNPGYAGTKDVVGATVLYRQQWFGFKGGPITVNASAHGQVARGRLGVGGFIINDQTGPQGRTQVGADLAYRLKTKIGYFAFGLQVSLINHRVDLSQVQTDIPDPAFQGGTVSSFRPDFGTGIFYNNGRLYVGFSVLHLVEFNMGLYGGDKSRLSRTYYLTGGYDFNMGKNLVLTPAVFFRASVGAPVQIDLNMNLLIRQKVWVGALYRWNDAFCILAGVYPIQRLRIGLAYDIPTSRIRPIASGSLEAFISIDFGKPKSARLITPRYFN